MISDLLEPQEYIKCLVWLACSCWICHTLTDRILEADLTWIIVWNLSGVLNTFVLTDNFLNAWNVSSATAAKIISCQTFCSLLAFRTRQKFLTWDRQQLVISQNLIVYLLTKFLLANSKRNAGIVVNCFCWKVVYKNFLNYRYFIESIFELPMHGFKAWCFCLQNLFNCLCSG